MSVPVIELETQDFVSASRRVQLWAGDRLGLATTRLCTVLDGSAAMAGSDAGGVSWAGVYDPAARAALAGAQNAIGAVQQLAVMFAQSARNYAAADAASTAGVRRLDAAAVGSLPHRVPYVLPVCVPSAAGGSAELPAGWGLIAHLVGVVWPNGHQDRLRAAGAAWQAAAAAGRDAADEVDAACGLAVSDRLPEAMDMWRVCDRLAGQLRELAEVQSGLGAACGALARQLDDAHAAVRGELSSLLACSAAIEVGSAAFSILTFGASEALGQGAEAARLAATAARVAAIIDRFTTLAGQLSRTLAALAERADRLAGTLTGLLDTRLTTAVLSQVRTMPGVGRALQLGSLARLSLTLRRDWPRISGLLQQAAREKGFYGLGTVTRQEADVIGKAWVGDGARLSPDGKAWVSKDGLRQYRPFDYKNRLGRSQANIEWRVKPRGQWLSNGHFDLKERR